MRVVRALLLVLFRRIMRLFFREIEVVGEPSRAVGRRLFAANHVNGIVDPLLVLTSVRFEVAPVAKATLWKIPGLRVLLDLAQAVPVVRRQDDPNKASGSNDEVFEKVASHLSGGGNMLIFPEGISHSEPKVQRLKSGAGRMLSAALAKGAKGLSYQAVGLEFEARETFRSRALVVFGPVRGVDELGLSGDELAEKITQQLAVDLPELVVEGESADERLLIARVAEMLAHEAGELSLAAWNALGRQVEAARKALGEGGHAHYQRVERAVTRYHELLASAGLRDADVAIERDPGEVALRRLWRVLLLPLALCALVLYAVPYQVPKLASKMAKGEGDVVSTYKIGLGLVVFPAWAALLVVLSLVLPLSSWMGVAEPWGRVIGALVSLLSPFAALPWLDAYDRYETRLARGGGDEEPSREELVAARKAALAEIEAARAYVVSMGASGQ